MGNKIIQRFDVGARMSEMSIYNSIVHLAGQIAEDRDLRALARHLVNSIHGLGIMGRAGFSRPVLRQMLNVALSVLDH